VYGEPLTFGALDLRVEKPVVFPRFSLVEIFSFLIFGFEIGSFDLFSGFSPRAL
jgi:hypothetical protein